MGKPKKADAVSARKRLKRSRVAVPNPFEVRVNKKKHEILGQKNASERGLPGVSRLKSIQKRKKTLLREYKERSKSNRFIDRRLGEYDAQLTPEEKMLQRFMLEKQRKHERGGAFNLEDDEEGLTHYGRSLGDMERFDEIEVSDEEETVEEDIKTTHFGGFLRKTNRDTEEVDEKSKSRKEILEEVVTKSKALKYERQQEKRKVEELLMEVDDQWKDLQSLFKGSVEAPETSVAPDDYDKAVKQLVFEVRGKATDRLKTEEEIAKEERERLERLEADRACRMRGDDPSAGRGIADNVSADVLGEMQRGGLRDERFILRYKDGKMVLPEARVEESTDVSKSNDDGEENGEEGEIEDESDGSAEEEETDNDSDLNSGDSETEEREGDEEEEEEEGVISPENLQQMKLAAQRELPYVLEVPATLQELQEIVNGRSPSDCLTAVERIHTCNHPSLHPRNKAKLEGFFPVLVQYWLGLGWELSKNNIALMDKLTKSLFKLAQLNSLHTAALIQKKLKLLFNSFHRQSKRSVSMSDLLLFKLIGFLFPTSDFRHPVTTPTLHCMAQLLFKCQPACICDVLRGLVVCYTCFEFIEVSKRYVPELVNYLCSVVGCFSRSSEAFLFRPFSRKSKLREQLSQSCSSTDGVSGSNEERSSVLVELLMDATTHHGSEQEFSPSSRLAVARVCLKLLLSLMDTYKHLPSFSEIFQPVKTNLECWAGEEQCLVAKELCVSALEALNGCMSDSCKIVLQLLKQKPKSIKFFEPKFDEVYEVNRRKARSRVSGEKQRLKHKVKRERKGAIRELKKDSSFLAREKLKDQLERDAEREKKTRQIMQDLEMMQHESKRERLKKH